MKINKITITVSTILAVLMLSFTFIMAGVHIDLYEAGNASHTFGYWKNGYKKFTTEPEKTVTIPIMDNGNYFGNPSHILFTQYIALCVTDTSQMTFDNYVKWINNH